MSDIHTIKLHDGRVLVLFEKLEGSETEEELSVYLDTVFDTIKEDMFHHISHFGRYGLLTVVLSELTEEQIIENNIINKVSKVGLKGLDYIIEDGYCHHTMTGFDGTIPQVSDTAKESLLLLLKENNIDTTKEWVLILKK